MFAGILSFATGFLSLSMEILWIRLFSYANHSLPQSFSFVLVFYLIGIAAGAYLGKFICQAKFNLWLFTGITLALSSIIDIVCPWVYVYHLNHQFYYAAFFITLTSLLKAIIFPIAHHIGTSNNVNNVARIYVANIFGSSIGPLITGCVLLSFFSTQQCFILIASFTFALSLWCLKGYIKQPVAYAVSTIVFLTVNFLWLINPHQLLIPLGPKKYPMNRMVENQYGIIATYHGGIGGDYVTGGNVYDGRTNLDPVINSNAINRLLILPAIQENPKKILLIGLSIGTWLKLLTGFPNVEQIDVVEINPGYLKAMADYQEQNSALADPRVKLYFDDGRRWLRAHPDNKYDLIVMNTTFYWRAYATNLLSLEFLKLIKKHMRGNSILTFNTTDSPDVFNTAAEMFKYAYLYQNFAIAADFDWRLKFRNSNAANKIAQITLDGKPLFKADNLRLIRNFLGFKIRSITDIKPFYEDFGRKIEIVSDRNLITEYKHGKNLYEISMIPW